MTPSFEQVALPTDAVVQRIAFVAEPAGARPVVYEFPAPLRRRAVLLTEAEPSPDPHREFTLLRMSPSASEPAADAGHVAAEIAQKWVEAAPVPGDMPSQFMIFQGAHICWSRHRCAVVAAPDRWDALRTAVAEVLFFELELADIERALGEQWPQLEADVPRAFESTDQSLAERKEMASRFQGVLLCRARLARIGPYVHLPHLHPPTLASQVAERFRERTRLAHRYEFLDEQLEVFEHVYEMCADRSSSHMHARSSNLLEWVIIVLLVAQLLLSGFELLTTLDRTPAETNTGTTATVE